MALVSKPYTFSAGATIIAAEHNSNFDILYSDYNGNIQNVNIASNAGIVYSKLSLANSILSSDINSSTTFDVANIPTGTTANKVVKLDSSARLPAVNGSLLTNFTASQIPAILGTWDYSTYSADTAYQAATDGFVLAVCTIQGNAVKSASILTDAANPPTHSTAIGSSTSSTTAVTLTLMSPVKKTHYWKVSNVAGSSVSQIYWIPLAS